MTALLRCCNTMIGSLSISAAACNLTSSTVNPCAVLCIADPIPLDLLPVLLNGLAYRRSSVSYGVFFVETSI